MTNWCLICFSFLFLPLLGATVKGDLCSYMKDYREPDPEEFQQQIGPWFQKQYVRWNKTASKSNPHFWQWYHTTFAPEIADTVISCNYTGICTVSTRRSCLLAHILTLPASSLSAASSSTKSYPSRNNIMPFESLNLAPISTTPCGMSEG